MHEKRVYYNVHNAMDLGNGAAKILIMQNISKVDGDTIPDDLKL